MKWLGLPPNASIQGGEIDQVIYLVHVLMFLLFVGWGAFFVYTLVRFRRSRNPKANYAGVKSHTSSYLEVGIAVIEAIILIGFSIPIWAKRVNAFPPESESTVVRVVAQQFLWNVHYPGPDGVFGRTDAHLTNEQSNPLGLDPNDPQALDDVTSRILYIPAHKPVIVKLSSKDVIHSFGVPSLRVKQDAIPGMVIPLWFTPKETGDFEIVCSQLCGIGHYRMRGQVIVQEESQFNTWLSEQKPALAAAGEEVW